MSNENDRPTVIFIEGEGWVSLVEGSTSHELPDPNRAFRFWRRFKLPRLHVSQDVLIALGESMKDLNSLDASNSSIPAGYTYLMQFTNHDITFNRIRGLTDEELTSNEIDRARAPALDLDSVYGRGLEDSRVAYDDSDRIKLKLGKTIPWPGNRFGVTGEYENDLPRDDPKAPKQARIGNPFNDENLAIAQTHVAFLKFHNRVVDYLRGLQSVRKQQMSEDDLFELARRTVVQRYQWIVWHDALHQHVDGDIYKKVQTDGRRFVYPNGWPKGTRPALPVEFAFAAFRFGHSMVRDLYEWNDVINSQGTFTEGGKLEYLFKFTHTSGKLFDLKALTSAWIVDWRRLYDFGPQDPAPNKQLNFARLIDTNLAQALHNLPMFGHEAHQSRSLAVRDLLVGQAVGLASGQAIAREMHITPFTECEEQYRKLPQSQREILEKHGLKESMPLWYYILAEAKAETDVVK